MIPIHIIFLEVYYCTVSTADAAAKVNDAGLFVT